MSVLSARLRELRGTQSQTDFAAALGMKYQQYARYEKGENVPSADFVTDVCRIHSVSADWLLGTGRTNSSVTANGSHAVAISGSNISVGQREDFRCAKCPIKRKLKALEKVFQKP